MRTWKVNYSNCDWAPERWRDYEVIAIRELRPGFNDTIRYVQRYDDLNVPVVGTEISFTSVYGEVFYRIISVTELDLVKYTPPKKSGFIKKDNNPLLSGRLRKFQK